METRQMTPFFYLLFLLYNFKINPPFYCCPLFSENHLNPQVRKMVNKHTVDYHPNHSQLISRIHALIFLWTKTFGLCFVVQ